MQTTMDSPFHRRWFAWMNERFPLPLAMMFFIQYITVAMLARYEAGITDITPGWIDFISCLVVWSYFLLLRVFDEHKDYAEDLINHPQRVLQRGLITLRHLKIAGVLCFTATLLWSLLRDGGLGPVTTAWLIMMIWTGLMAVEFFCRDWLSARLVIYGLSHMLVMPLFAGWCIQLAVPGQTMTLNLMLITALFFFSGLLFEVTRKTWGPEEERDGVDGYSKAFGTRRSAVVVLALALLSSGLFAWLCFNIQQSLLWPGYLLLLAGLAGALISVGLFIQSPSASARKKNEAAMGLLVLTGYVAVIAALAFRPS